MSSHQALADARIAQDLRDHKAQAEGQAAAIMRRRGDCPAVAFHTELAARYERLAALVAGGALHTPEQKAVRVDAEQAQILAALGMDDDTEGDDR